MRRPFPSAGRVNRSRPERALLLCYFDASGIITPIENIAYLQRYSRFALDVVNLYGHPLPFRLPASFPWTDYDVIIFHNTIAYTIDNLFEIDRGLSLPLRDHPGVKVLFKQDEQYRTNKVAQFIAESGIDLVFTCLPSTEIDKAYPPAVTGPVSYRRMLTGYVTPSMREYVPPPDIERRIDIGYRGSIQPIYFGRLAHEKREIGDLFKAHTAHRSSVTDIESSNAARLSGLKWIEFLGSCKGTLGTESGASIFDLDGTLEPFYQSLVNIHGEHPESVAWCEEILAQLQRYEGYVNYSQISPRHFEAASTRTVQILYEGTYSGIFSPHRHYLSLRKDFANVDEVIDALMQPTRRKLVSEAAYEEIIRNPRYWIETFAREFDTALDNLLEKKDLKRKETTHSIEFPSGTSPRNVLLLCAHVPKRDPRISWLADFAPKSLKIHVLGVHDDPSGPVQSVSNRITSALEVQIFRRNPRHFSIESRTVEACGFGEIANNPGLLALNFVNSLSRIPDDIAAKALGEAMIERLPAIRWYLDYLLDTTCNLVKAAEAFERIDLLIAADLDCLIAGVILKNSLKIPLIYDAHEYWPESDPNGSPWEIGFWRELEALLMPATDARFTVSGPLGQLMSSVYNIPFGVVPNAEPVVECPPKMGDGSDTTAVVFLYQGGYAKGRGLELLIRNWEHTDQRAVLHLRGPRWEYSEKLEELAASTGLLGHRIFFLDAVAEEELVAAAAYAAVGVIPYEPHGANNRLCCPNKLSQYAAAALPIFANATEYVSSIVEEQQIGKVADYRNKDSFVDAVDYLVENAEYRLSAGERARAFFIEKFNWQAVSSPIYDAINRALEQQNSAANSQSASPAENPDITSFSYCAVQPDAPILNPSADASILNSSSDATTELELLKATELVPQNAVEPESPKRSATFRLSSMLWRGLPAPLKKHITREADLIKAMLLRTADKSSSTTKK